MGEKKTRATHCSSRYCLEVVGRLFAPVFLLPRPGLAKFLSSVNFEEILLRALGNSEVQNNILEHSINYF
jgi:hypothetical protein